MSVLIKGMTMPTRCEDCGFLKVMCEPPRCGWTDTKVLGNGNARLNNCPLVPVPPHGRLIDADALPRFGGRKGLVHSADIDNAPTIIEAEGGE